MGLVYHSVKHYVYFAIPALCGYYTTRIWEMANTKACRGGFFWDFYRKSGWNPYGWAFGWGEESLPAGATPKKPHKKRPG